MSKHAPDNTRTYLMEWDYEHPYMPGRLWKEIRASVALTEYSVNEEAYVYLTAYH